MGFVAPLGEFVQLDGESTEVCCNTKPGVFGVQEMVALPGVVETIVSVGAPMTWMDVGNAQKPPVREYWLLVIGVDEASGWPIVPLTEYTPPVLVPPPPSIVDHGME